MPDPFTYIISLQHLAAPIGLGWLYLLACLVGLQKRFHLVASPAGPARKRAALVPLAVGGALWSEQFISLAPGMAGAGGFAPEGVLTSLVVLVAAVGAAFVLFLKFGDGRGFMSGAAVFGLGITTAQIIVVASLRGAAEPLGADVGIPAAVALASGFSALALYIAKRWPSRRGRLAAAVMLSLGGAGSQAAVMTAFDISAGPAQSEALSIPTDWMVVLALTAMSAIFWGLRAYDRIGARRATRLSGMLSLAAPKN